MKRIIILFIFLVQLFGFFVFAQDQGGYTIDKYSVDMNLNTDGSSNITEDIYINFLEARHGIYRQIPIKHSSGYYLHIDNISSNQPIADKTIDNDYYVIKLGSADKTVIGPVKYEINYKTINTIRAYSESGSVRSELYRNILGNERDVAIGEFSFTIKLPKEYTFDKDDMFLLYGYKGDRLTGGAAIYQSGLYIYGNIDSKLNPNAGVTVGLKFPADYFQVSDDYNTKFYENPSDSSSNISGWIIFMFFVVPFVIVIIIIATQNGSDKSPWKSKYPTTIYYTPPEDINPSKAFWFWYNDKNPKIFAALIYYWCAKGWTRISHVKGDKGFWGFGGEDKFHISETGINPIGTTNFDDNLIQNFFGKYDNEIDNRVLDQELHPDIDNLLGKLKNSFEMDNIYFTRKVNIFSLFGVSDCELTEEGKKLFEKLRGYREYLLKVEKPVLQKELESDTAYFDKVIPWAVLFGLETKVLEAAENILADVGWYNSYDNKPLNLYMFNSLNQSAKLSAIIPVSDTSSSGFGSWGGGGGGGYSGGGGGGGGGGSW